MKWENGPFEVLRGKWILGFSWGGDSIVFHSEDGKDHKFTVYGDCCSESFIYAVRSNGLAPFTVREFEEFTPTDEEVAGAPCPQEVNSNYGCRLLTDKWPLEIVYINSSNGYYGGYVQYEGEVK